MGWNWQRPTIVPDKYTMTAAIVSPGDAVLTGNHLKIIDLPPMGWFFNASFTLMSVTKGALIAPGLREVPPSSYRRKRRFSRQANCLRKQ